MSGKRRAAERRGRSAELVAALWLIAKGYRILGRRVRTPFGEIDIAAWRGGVLAIVEVKARASYDAGVEAVGYRQQERLARAAETLAGRWRMTAAPIRYDIVVVGAGVLPRHVRGAFFDPALR